MTTLLPQGDPTMPMSPLTALQVLEAWHVSIAHRPAPGARRCSHLSQLAHPLYLNWRESMEGGRRPTGYSH